MKKLVLAVALSGLALPALAAGESYSVDTRHTFPSFEVDHLGFSTQRGRFDRSSGRITLDRAARQLSVDISIDAASISTGLGELEKHLKAEDFFHVEKHPRITFKSTSARFDGDKPVAVSGDFTLLGVTRPVTLTLTHFNCGVHPMNKKNVCGADASATIKRSEFGMNYAVPAVSDEVKLLIQVEAIRD